MESESSGPISIDLRLYPTSTGFGTKIQTNIFGLNSDTGLNTSNQKIINDSRHLLKSLKIWEQVKILSLVIIQRTLITLIVILVVKTIVAVPKALKLVRIRIIVTALDTSTIQEALIIILIATAVTKAILSVTVARIIPMDRTI